MSVSREADKSNLQSYTFQHPDIVAVLLQQLLGLLLCLLIVAVLNAMLWPDSKDKLAHMSHMSCVSMCILQWQHRSLFPWMPWTSVTHLLACERG